MISGIKSPTKVPTGAVRLQGFSQAKPETVKLLSIKGFPRRNASEIATKVPTLSITQPQSAGSFPAGISLFNAAFTRVFSPPCGYLVLQTVIPIFSERFAFSIASCKTGTKSILLSSITMIPAFAFTA